MNNRATERAPTPTFTLRNLHFGRFVAVAKSNKQSGMLDGGAEWAIATELPASLRTALDVEPRPEASLGRLCISDEPRAALVTVSTEYTELCFILPLGDTLAIVQNDFQKRPARWHQRLLLMAPTGGQGGVQPPALARLLPCARVRLLATAGSWRDS